MRKEKPEETGSRRSASEGTARCGEKPRRTDADEDQRRRKPKERTFGALRKISVSF